MEVGEQGGQAAGINAALIRDEHTQVLCDTTQAAEAGKRVNDTERGKSGVKREQGRAWSEAS